MPTTYKTNDIIYVKDLDLEGKVMYVKEDGNLLVTVGNNRMVVDPKTNLIVRG